VHRLHPSPPARLAVYALFAFSLGVQAFFAPNRGVIAEVIALLCIAISTILALASFYFSFSKQAPFTESPPPSASSALVAFFAKTWLAPLQYLVFYIALLGLAALVAIPVYALHFTGYWLAFLVLLALGGCFLLEYLFRYLLRVNADSLPEPLRLPPDK